jgi:uncharacterized membrane protein
MNNLFPSLLKTLKVKHTVWYSQKRFTEHPNKDNLLGISSLLNDYAVHNAAVRLEGKNIEKLNTPFVVQTTTAFIVVTEYDNENVTFLWENKKIKMAIDTFKELWTGVVLIAEPDENSIEPDYVKNRKSELINEIRRYFAFAIPIIFIGYFFCNRIHSIENILPILLNAIGVIVCLLLVSKQIDTSGKIVDKICSLFSKKDCNSILESDASKIWGIGWSEIGLSYFVSNILILTIFPHFIIYMLFINTIVLPYSFWSIWYQAKVAKQWCPLCIIVMTLLWGLFCVYLSLGFFDLPFTNLFLFPKFFFNTLFTGLIYISPLVFINLYLSAVISAVKTPKLTQSINSLKSDKNVCFALLKKQAYFETTLSDSHIIFGNPESKLRITIVINPHCPPCTKMHKKVSKFIKDMKDNICVQYILFSFYDLKISNYFLAYIYMRYLQVEDIFDKWFESGKYYRNDFFKEYGFDSENITDEIKEEITLHDNWIEKTKIDETPTILVNGYKLPEIYNFEDLVYVFE